MVLHAACIPAWGYIYLCGPVHGMGIGDHWLKRHSTYKGWRAFMRKHFRGYILAFQWATAFTHYIYMLFTYMYLTKQTSYSQTYFMTNCCLLSASLSFVPLLSYRENDQMNKTMENIACKHHAYYSIGSEPKWWKNDMCVVIPQYKMQPYILVAHHINIGPR